MRALKLLPLLALTSLNAQDAAPTMTMEERRASVVQIEKNIEAREARLEELVSDIKTLDDRTEAKIDKVVETLKNLSDSQASKTRITRLKGRAIAGLRSSITSYNNERRKIFERIRTGNSETTNALGEYIDKLDERIQKRVNQIMELAKSMPPSEDVAKYERDSEAYYNGRYFENSRISEEWRANRRQGVATKKELSDLIKALEGAIADLERRVAAISARLEQGNLSPANTELAKQELARNESVLESRKNELLELSTPAGTTYGDPANRSTADHLAEMFDNARGDISTDHWTVLKKYDEAVDELDTINKMKANLADRKKWLSENDK